MTFIQGTIGEKTAQCAKNLKAVVEAAGSDITKIVKVNIFLANMDDFAVCSLVQPRSRRAY
jgi:enamine deaminase RidA (YjgF/YER057c/UK114 family)